MTRESIVEKLRAEIDKGIETEAQASYVMAEVRKLLEQQQAKEQYEYLTFHCDWAVHSKLQGRTTQKILRLFDAANIQLRAGGKLHGLPPEQRNEIDAISKMRYFERELNQFLQANQLPSLDSKHADGWVRFLHLYARIVSDCPLVMTTKNQSATITHVTLSVEVAKQIFENEVWFKVTWKISDKNGRSGSLFVINSMSVVR
jgi:hypothetical protein